MSKLVRRRMVEEEFETETVTTEESTGKAPSFDLDWLFLTPQGWVLLGLTLWGLFSYQEKQPQTPVIINNQAPPPIVINNN